MSASIELPGDWDGRVRGALAGAGELGVELAAGEIAVLGAGMESVAMIVAVGERRYVMRLPKGEWGAEGMVREARLLPELGPRVGLPIPRFAFTAPNPLGPGEFCVYPVVPGEVVLPEEWHRRGLLGAGTARQVAEFLEQVHAFPVERAVELGVEVADFRADFSETLDMLEDEVVPLLDAQRGRRLVAVYERYLGDAENFAYRPTLIHGDVSLDHLLIEGDRISGVIDFGDTQVGDPDYDLCYLWAEAGADFVRQVQQGRGRELDASLVRKLEFWTCADPADDILHGIENDMPDLREQSLGRLVRALDGLTDQAGVL
ncbi:phosphotransferase family protein [Nocardia otitidiscaviarum]|nr:phosphotransferase [Nocardia otitidiscaviarum]